MNSVKIKKRNTKGQPLRNFYFFLILIAGLQIVSVIVNPDLMNGSLTLSILDLITLVALLIIAITFILVIILFIKFVKHS